MISIGRATRQLWALLVFCTAALPVFSQDLKAQFIQIDLGREFGFFSKSPAHLRAVAMASSQNPSSTALLFFPGWPGQLWLPENMQAERFITNAPNSRFYATRHIDLMPSKGITFVMVDCPTDQWGSSQRSADPTGCSDSYRSSQQHADDIAHLIAHLKATQGIKRIFIMGHSYGSISSRWLAMRLGDQIQGSIHSASMSYAAGMRFADYGSSISRMDMAQAKAPWIFVHNLNDQCKATPYVPIQTVAGTQLITVRGGTPQGDPCGAGHFHSYQGRELAVLDAVARWITSDEITLFAGDP
jgi:predicted alpha/beta hydrolase family esterase